MSRKLSREERGREFLACCWHHLGEKTWLGEQRCGEAPGDAYVYLAVLAVSPPLCLWFEFEALRACQRACQLLYLLDAIKVFLLCICYIHLS